MRCVQAGLCKPALRSITYPQTAGDGVVGCVSQTVPTLGRRWGAWGWNETGHLGPPPVAAAAKGPLVVCSTPFEPHKRLQWC
jgi:hypothetical protein